MDYAQRDKEFIGQGWAFPVQFNPRGQIALVTGATELDQSIRIILETVPGERVMRPEFGCRAKELLFGPRNAATRQLMINYVTQALERWEPRIALNRVDVRDEPGRDDGWFVEISYTIKDTHDTRSIVYPFFIMDEPEPLELQGAT
ncbi:MAG: GPW/gp25 family protein [Anaerolineales bacterium]